MPPEQAHGHGVCYRLRRFGGGLIFYNGAFNPGSGEAGSVYSLLLNLERGA